MPVKPGFQYLDHMTDAFIEANGSTLEEAFENAARGLTDTMVDLSQVSAIIEIKVEAKGEDLEELLFDWLDKVMLLILTEHLVMSDFKVRINWLEDNRQYHLLGIANGEKLDLNKHRYKLEIKAVTYHQMSVAEEDGKFTVRFLLDL